MDSLDELSTLSLEEPIVRSQTMEFFSTCYTIMSALLA